jgi:hypothetical protein
MKVKVSDKAEIYRHFPKLKDARHRFTSPPDPKYNCIAWSVNDTTRFWWPDHLAYWPDDVPPNDSLDAFVHMYSKLGYSLTDLVPKEDAEAVAIYGAGFRVKHAARRSTDSPLWKSKLGEAFDIEHTLNAIEAGLYGSLLAIMVKKVQSFRCLYHHWCPLLR